MGVTTPKINNGHFITEDKKDLPLRYWSSIGKPKAVLLALHGFNMYGQYFKDPAEWWSKLGITTYAYDLRGFGGSPQAGIWGGSTAMASDASSFLKILIKRYSSLPIYLLGDSMGAAVALLAMTNLTKKETERIKGIILVAPGLWGRASMNPILRSGLWLSAHIAPWKTISGSSLKRRASDNISMLRDLSKDPLVIKTTRIDAAYGVANLMGYGFSTISKIATPTLILYGAKDEIVPLEPILDAVKKFKRPPDFITYKEGWHMLLKDFQAIGVWEDIYEWINNSVGRKFLTAKISSL